MKNYFARRRMVRCLRATERYFTRQYPHTPVSLPEPQPVSRAQLLVNGSEALPEILAMIDAAKHTIRWQVMLIHPDQISSRLVQALARAARRGVRVQLSFAIGQSMNGSPADRTPREEKRRDNQQMRLLLGVLRGAGVEVRENPAGTNFALSAAGPRARAIQSAIQQAVCIPANHYDHRKILVVDGCAALLGGMNVGQQYLYEFAPDLTLSMVDDQNLRRARGQPETWAKWLDVSIIVEGPLLREICAAFDWKWEVLGGEALPSPAPGMESGADRPGAGWGQFLEQRPGHTEISTRFFDLVRSARHELWLASPFISYAPALEALRAAARSGVKVTLIVPGAFQEMPVSRRIFCDFVPCLLEDGVQVWFNDQRMVHTKLMVVDGQVTLLGSFNLNFRSFQHDLEVAVVIEDEGLANSALQRVFDPYLQISTQVANNEVNAFQRSAGSLLNWLIRPFT